MERLQKNGLILVKNENKVYFSHFLTFPGPREDDFLPGTGGLYTIELDDTCFDGMGLAPERIFETEEGLGAVFSNSVLALHVSFSYDAASGVWSRRDTLTNKTNEVQILRKCQSRFALAEADQPLEAYTQRSGWCSENQGAWQDIDGGLHIETCSLRVLDGATPYLALRKKDSCKGIAFHLAPIGKWSISITKRVVYGGSYVIDMGLAESGLHMKIAPGESLRLPEVLFHSFSDVGLGAHKIHRFVLENRFRANPPKVIYNSWIYNFNHFTVEDLRRQVKAAAEIGCDYFLVDAGWYGEGDWASTTGDWRESRSKFPDGLKSFGDEVRAAGLGLGLWMECERASTKSEIYQKHPEYFFEIEGNSASVIVDFSNPEARQHVFNEISRLIDTYDLKMMKFDFNVGGIHDRTGSNFYRYYQNFYAMLEELKKKYPDFFFEGCAGGGCCADLSSMARYDCHHMTDTVHPLMDLRIYQGAVLRLPPFSLSKWVCIQNADLKSVNVSYQTQGRVLSNASQFLWERMTDCGLDFILEQASMGLLGFTSDLAALNEETRAGLKKAVADFKAHALEKSQYVGTLLTPPAPLSDARKPAIFQFSDFDFTTSIIKAFRTEGVEQTFIVEPVGLCEDALYEIEEDGARRTVSGREIQEFGLSLTVDGFYKVKTVILKRHTHCR